MKRFLVLCALFLFLPFAVRAAVSTSADAATGSPALQQASGAAGPPKASFFKKLSGTIGKIAAAAIDPNAQHLNFKNEIIKGAFKRLLPFVYRTAAETLAAASTVLGYDPGATVPPAAATTTPATAITDSGSSASLPQSAVRISEAYPIPASGEHEWIELIDRSNVAASLEGWTIEDGRGNATALSGTLLPWTRMVIESPRGQLNDSGDLIVLKDATGRPLDGVAYGDWGSGYPNVGEVRQGESLIRLEQKESFAVTTTPTPGAANVLVERPAAAVPPPPVAAAPVVPSTIPPTVTGAPAAAADTSGSPIIKSIAVVKKVAAKSRYSGSEYLAVVAAPPGVYSNTRMFVLIDEALREVRLSKASGADLPAGQSISFIAQEKGAGTLSYLLANPDSIRALDGSTDAAFTTIEAWPDQAGAYRFEAELVARQGGVISAKLGENLGDVLAPPALSSSLKTGDIISVEGYVEPGERPRAVLASAGSLTLSKAYQPEAAAPKPAPAMKLPWAAAAVLTLIVVIIGAYSYLRHQRLQRMALVLRPVDAEEEI